MKYWLIGLKDGKEKDTIPTGYNQAWRRGRLAGEMIKWGTGITEVYEVTNTSWTQSVCELSPVDFVTWIRKNGKQIG